jgi:lipopolysaccharide/colanic/teichoic acid biosynthesis glycosyltransferase
MNELALADEAFMVLARQTRPEYQPVKRCIDLVGAVLLFVALLPVFLVIALLVRLDSRGPVLYRQERMGSRSDRSDGERVWRLRPFVFLKFRTMFADVDSSPHEKHVEAFVLGQLGSNSASNAGFKLNGDPRVTRIGRILRRTSLDELPQLFNVIKGDMSLVGPRPVPLYEVALYREEHRERFAARPGMTGLWQVSGRCDVSFEEMINLDTTYVRRQSLWLDAKILFLTIPAVVGGRGAA